MTSTCVVTICSLNYLSKALVLCDSYKQYHPDHSFCLVIVDKKTSLPESLLDQSMLVIWVEDLGIPNFLHYAFCYDVIELNTNVKPTAMRHLLNLYDQVIYLDPDIEVFAELSPVFDGLNNSSIILTPHYMEPILDGCKPDDLDLLKFGLFNLGFIGVSRCEESFKFLDWWSARCLEYGFYEIQSGLAVDQKWASLAVSFFPNILVTYDCGLNLAFWNLHERQITTKDDELYVNSTHKLRFIHFSSFNINRPEAIAGKQTRFTEFSRPDFGSLAKKYASKIVLKDNLLSLQLLPFSYDYFDDGVYITPALRRFYSTLKSSLFSNVTNPFASDGIVKKFAIQNKLISSTNTPHKRMIFKDVESQKSSIYIINRMLRLVLRLMGPEKYFNFMKYLAHISSLRNQSGIFMD